MSPLIKPFSISRLFAAPREKVWQAWTDRAQLLQWFGPKGFKMTTANLDLRPGGTFHYCLETPDGKELWGKFSYREILAPERLVLVSSFSDAGGGVTRHPFSATWPLEMLSTSTFTIEGDQTRFSLECLPLNATEAECQTFDRAHEGMKQGWTGTLDQLTAHLKPS